LSEELEVLLNRYEAEIQRLERMWREYQEAVRRSLNSWISDRTKVMRKISEYTGLVEKYNDEIKELAIRHNIGLIEEKELTEMVEDLKNKISEVERILNNIKSRLEELDKNYMRHALQAKLPFVSTTVKEIKERLAKLEKLKEEGKVSEEVYEKLRQELEEQLRALGEEVQMSTASTPSEESTSSS